MPNAVYTVLVHPKLGIHFGTKPNIQARLLCSAHTSYAEGKSIIQNSDCSEMKSANCTIRKNAISIFSAKLFQMCQKNLFLSAIFLFLKSKKNIFDFHCNLAHFF